MDRVYKPHKHVYEISATFCMSDSYIGCERTGSEKQVLFWYKNMAAGSGSWTILPSSSFCRQTSYLMH